MDDIDVTSSMGRDLPCMFYVVEAATMLRFERNLAQKLGSRSGGPTSRRVVRIGRSSQLLHDELLKRFGDCCLTRSARVGDEAAPHPRPTWTSPVFVAALGAGQAFGVAAIGLSAAPVRPASLLRLTSSVSSSRSERRVRVLRVFRPIWFLQTGAREGDRVWHLMLRVSTIRASSAGASAKYYTRYLTGAPGEVPGVWSGGQAAGLGLSGEVGRDDLQALLEGRDPISGTRLGYPLIDRVTL